MDGTANGAHLVDDRSHVVDGRSHVVDSMSHLVGGRTDLTNGMYNGTTQKDSPRSNAPHDNNKAPYITYKDVLFSQGDPGVRTLTSVSITFKVFIIRFECHHLNLEIY